jgi:hypothetical protein
MSELRWMATLEHVAFGVSVEDRHYGLLPVHTQRPNRHVADMPLTCVMERVRPLRFIVQFAVRDPVQVPNVIIVRALTAAGPPGKSFVTRPATVPVPTFDVLPFSNVTEPVRLPPETSPSCASLHVQTCPFLAHGISGQPRTSCELSSSGGILGRPTGGATA